MDVELMSMPGPGEMARAASSGGTPGRDMSLLTLLGPVGAVGGVLGPG
jgi:hypothetical protein